MVQVIDLDVKGLTRAEIIRLAKRTLGVVLRAGGRPIGRLLPADDLDLEDEAWAQEPAQVRRGAAARRRRSSGHGVSHAAVKRRLGIPSRRGSGT